MASDLQGLLSHCREGGAIAPSPQTDVDAVAERFLTMWQRTAPPCGCCAQDCARDASCQAESAPARDACDDMLGLLKLQAAWHAWCVRQERFECVTRGCARMLRWRRRHTCWAATVLDAYVQQLQGLCKALHGFRLDVAA